MNWTKIIDGSAVKKMANIVEYKFLWGRNGCKVEFEVNVEIPLNAVFDDFLGMLCKIFNVPLFANDELRKDFQSFVDKETARFYDESGSEILDALRKNNASNHTQDSLTKYWVNSYVEEYKTFAPPEIITDDEVFRDAYQSLLVSDPENVKKLLAKEKQFADDMQKVIRARNWEVERMKQDHATLIDRAIEDLGVVYSDQEVNKLAANQFEKIHLVESNYASQLSALVEQQKREFREFVLRLNENSFLNKNPSDFLETPDEENILKRQHSDSLHEPRRFDESFTIHLGAQLKTMHNLRLTGRNPYDLCILKSRNLEASQRLQMALSLYSNQLHGLVLLVDARPMFHINLRTDFMKACEQSTELHFADLENQLKEVENDLIRANTWRSTIPSTSSSSPPSTHESSPSRTMLATFKYGDVYVTRHSNLSQVHTVFHLVIRDDVKTQEMNSRHPCINGIRNIVRLCYKFGVTNISIPLLLVDTLTEDLTISWCLKRAELVFKCVKGFMMECATLSSSNEQYTMQFFVPTDVSFELFNQLSEMLPTIFHLANPVIVKRSKS